MSEPISQPQTLSSETVREEWASIVERVTQQQTRVLVEEDGVAIAAIVSIADLQRLTLLDEQRVQFLAALDRTQAAFADIPDDELAAEIENALVSVRAATPGSGSR